MTTKQTAQRPNWPTAEEPARALIGPTGFGTFGIIWRDFPALERRGGYSGPYDSFEDAEDGARGWLEFWDLDQASLNIERVANVNDLPGEPER